MSHLLTARALVVIVCLCLVNFILMTSLAGTAQIRTPMEAKAVPAKSGLSQAHTGLLRSPVFLPLVEYDSGGSYPISIALADLNGDSQVDVVVPNWVSDTLAVLLGNGDGTFRPAQTLVDSSPRWVSAADLNRDGKPDLVVVDGRWDSVGVLLGNGDGTFKAAVRYAVDAPLPLAIGDINEDGSPDLIVAAASGMTTLLGNGDGTFQAGVTYRLGGGPVTSVAVADLNRDGKIDVAAAHYQDSNPFVASVLVFLGNGDGTLQPVATYDSGGWAATSIVAADVSSDNIPDLLVGNSCPDYRCIGNDGVVGMLLGRGDGTFQPAIRLASTGRPYSLAVSDVNGDGHPDLALSNISNIGVMPGHGNGTFDPVLIYGLGAHQGYWTAQSVATADVNQDGKPDLLFTAGISTVGYDGSVGLLLNDTPFCTSPPTIKVSPDSKFLWPPNGKMIPVTVSGTITDPTCGVVAAGYVVKDEYGELHYSGPLTLSVGGAYTFVISLPASRRGSDLDGRRYTLVVNARNRANKNGSQANTVIVLHDRRQLIQVSK